jgi:hypothetical protein
MITAHAEVNITRSDDKASFWKNDKSMLMPLFLHYSYEKPKCALSSYRNVKTRAIAKLRGKVPFQSRVDPRSTWVETMRSFQAHDVVREAVAAFNT